MLVILIIKIFELHVFFYKCIKIKYLENCILEKFKTDVNINQMLTALLIQRQASQQNVTLILLYQ